MRIDGHVHLWDARRGAMPTPYALPALQATVDDLLSHMAGEGVERAVLVQPQVHGSDHRLLASALARHPDRFVGFGLVDADAASPDAILDDVRAVADLGLAGVRLHLVGGTGKHAPAVAAAAARHGLALEVHVDEESWTRLEPLVAAAGERLVVVDHLARPDDPRSQYAREMLRVLAGHANVVVKVAALDVVSRRPFPHEDVLPLIAATVDAFGPNRLMWGSNFPWRRGEDYGASLHVIERLGLPDDANEAILGGTASRLFFAVQSRVVV
ncbi:MAG: amidohydrolase family protein [Solirubrobacteraceae bacterium]